MAKTRSDLPKLPPPPDMSTQMGQVYEKSAYAIPARTASKIQTGKTTRERVAGIDELMTDPRYRASRGLVGSGVSLESPKPVSTRPVTRSPRGRR